MINLFHRQAASSRRTKARVVGDVGHVGIVGAAVLLLVSVLTSCAKPPEVQGPPRNFILISLDTLRADHLGLYGYPRDTSPFLDSLAEEALIFDHAFAQYPSTLTSHMTMLTGLYPGEHDVYPPAGRLSPEIKTVAEQLSAAGYQTAGHTEGGYVRGVFGFRRGFDDFAAFDRSDNSQVEKTFLRGRRFLRNLEADRPFFLFLHTYAAHAPYTPPEKYASMFWADEMPGDAFVPTPNNLVEANKTGLAQSAEAIDYYRAMYDGGIRYLDDVLREFFAELETLGLRDNTTVIITSDHGEEFREHGRFNHEQLYDEILRVPLLILSPEVEPRRTETVAELVDVTPTILHLANVPFSAAQGSRVQVDGELDSSDSQTALSGLSLVPMFGGDASYPKRIAYAEASRGRRSLYSLGPSEDRSGVSSRKNSLLHLLTFPKEAGYTGEAVELYRTSSDPEEQSNLALEDPNNATELARLLAGRAFTSRAASEQGVLDEELRKQLEALGYLQ